MTLQSLQSGQLGLAVLTTLLVTVLAEKRTSPERTDFAGQLYLRSGLSKTEDCCLWH